MRTGGNARPCRTVNRVNMSADYGEMHWHPFESVVFMLPHKPLEPSPKRRTSRIKQEHITRLAWLKPKLQWQEKKAAEARRRQPRSRSMAEWPPFSTAQRLRVSGTPCELKSRSPSPSLELVSARARSPFPMQSYPRRDSPSTGKSQEKCAIAVIQLKTSELSRAMKSAGTQA